jgi:hypothetical protein
MDRKYIDTSDNHGSRIYQSSAGLPDKSSTIASAWLEKVPFQLSVTVRPTAKVASKSIVKELLNQAEKFHKSYLSCVIGYEDQPIDNAHLCIASPVSLSKSWIEFYLSRQPVTSKPQQAGSP